MADPRRSNAHYRGLEAIRGSVPAQTAPAGRFVPARSFDAIENLPSWKNWAPRLGVAYDLRGDGLTALKFSIGRYMQQEATGFAAKYNPLQEGSDIVTWSDLNGNDLAEDNELGRPNDFDQSLTSLAASAGARMRLGTRRLVPFGQVLVGVERRTLDVDRFGSDSSTHLLVQPGGGVALRLSGRLNVVGQIDWRHVQRDDDADGVRLAIGARLRLR